MYAIVYKVILFRFGVLVRIKYNLSNFLEKELVRFSLKQMTLSFLFDFIFSQ